MSKQEELMEVPASVIEANEGGDYENVISRIENAQAAFSKLKQVGIRYTSNSDWINHNGKPYLQGSGAEKIARPFSLTTRDLKLEREDREDDRGRYYIYTCLGTAEIPGLGGGEFIGTATSRDAFLGTNYDKKRKDGSVFKELPDVDEGNIKKKAYTNFTVNAITRLIGLRGLTWEELANYGIHPEGKGSVTHKAGGKSKGQARTKTKGKKDSPVWDWKKDDGTDMISAKEGDHFSAAFLKGCGFFQSKNKPEIWSREYSDDALEILRKEWERVEKGGDKDDDLPPAPEGH